MQEQWKPVVVGDFGKRYHVSSLGRIKVVQVSIYSNSKTDILRPTIHHKGYVCVTLYYQGRSKWSFVHNLVAAAFLPEKPSKSHVILHYDDNKQNNTASNLRWGTTRENFDDAVRNNGHDNKGSKNGHAKLTEDAVKRMRKRHAENVSQKELATEFGVCLATVANVISRRSWNHVT